MLFCYCHDSLLIHVIQWVCVHYWCFASNTITLWPINKTIVDLSIHFNYPTYRLSFFFSFRYRLRYFLISCGFEEVCDCLFVFVCSFVSLLRFVAPLLTLLSNWIKQKCHRINVIAFALAFVLYIYSHTKTISERVYLYQKLPPPLPSSLPLFSTLSLSPRQSTDRPSNWTMFNIIWHTPMHLSKEEEEKKTKNSYTKTIYFRFVVHSSRHNFYSTRPSAFVCAYAFMSSSFFRAAALTIVYTYVRCVHIYTLYIYTITWCHFPLCLTFIC